MMLPYDNNRGVYILLWYLRYKPILFGILKYGSDILNISIINMITNGWIDS
jgi:hypothetical protein